MIAVNGGTEDNLQGNKYYTSSELTSIYDDSMADTYVIGEDKSSVAGHNSTMIAGPNQTWNTADNFDGATDADGNPIDLKDVMVSGTVNPQVTYSYQNAVGNTISKTVAIHVVARQIYLT